jgi:hypothetical protein
MGADTKIIDIIRKAAGTHNMQFATMVLCEVTAVDLDSRTCTCTPLSGSNNSDLTNVLLMAVVDDGFLAVPAIGASVIVQYTPLNQPYIAMHGGLDQLLIVVQNGIQFQGGEFGGLTKTLELQTQLNKTNALLQAIITIISGSPIPEPGSNTPSALQQALNAAIAGQELGDYSEIENTTITHGE